MIRTLLVLSTILLATAAVAQWNEQTQTFTPSDGQVVLYDDYRCTGEPFMVLQLSRMYDDFRSFHTDSGTWNDRASCIHVGPNTTIAVYEHIKFGGKTKTFLRTRSNPEGKYSLSGDWWNNQISSAQVPAPSR